MNTSVARHENEFSGIYELGATARYLRVAIECPVTTRRLIRWIRSGLTAPELRRVPGRYLLLTFEELISLRVIATLRAAGFSLQQVRRAETYFRKLYEEPHPFARRGFWTARPDIYTDFAGALISGSREGQQAMPFIRESLQRVSVDFDEHGVVNAWYPYADVALLPTVQFGEPCIENTRIPTSAVAAMVQEGDSIPFVAESYGVSEEKIVHAVEWQQRIEQAA